MTTFVIPAIEKDGSQVIPHRTLFILYGLLQFVNDIVIHFGNLEADFHDLFLI